MDIPRKSKSRITCLYAIPLACALGAFASQVDGQNAPPPRPVTRSSTGGTSTSPEAAAMMNQELTE
jgi:hypothetical protein